MVQNRAVDEAVFNVTGYSNAAQPFPEHPIILESCANHGGTLPCQQAKKEQRRAWDGPAVGKTFASVSSSDSYSPAFQATKNRLERNTYHSGADSLYRIAMTYDMFEFEEGLIIGPQY
ncbi:hypothetical protein TNCV_2048821 [Trichonephila clavipes]|nr:hypothetical protein TNCV_2048821 [Trichonephila clavipes]